MIESLGEDLWSAKLELDVKKMLLGVLGDWIEEHGMPDVRIMGEEVHLKFSSYKNTRFF